MIPREGSPAVTLAFCLEALPGRWHSEVEPPVEREGLAELRIQRSKFRGLRWLEFEKQDVTEGSYAGKEIHKSRWTEY